jgi:hypothetical protein
MPFLCEVLADPQHNKLSFFFSQYDLIRRKKLLVTVKEIAHRAPSKLNSRCMFFSDIINKRSAIKGRNISYTNQGNILVVGMTEL